MTLKEATELVRDAREHASAFVREADDVMRSPPPSVRQLAVPVLICSILIAWLIIHPQPVFPDLGPRVYAWIEHKFGPIGMWVFLFVAFLVCGSALLIIQGWWQSTMERLRLWIERKRGKRA
jgi:hypothetical protein